MTDHSPIAARPDSGSLARDVVLVLAVGIALGVAHNALMLASGSGKGLAWVKVERTLVRLEDVAPELPQAADTARIEMPQTHPVTPAGAPTRSGPATRASSARLTLPAEAVEGAPKPREAERPPRSPGTETTSPAAATTSAVASPATDAPAIPESREPIEAGLAIVRRLHAANAAVFVDARTAAEYAEGHVAGAINVPFDDVFKDPKRLDSFADRGLPIVTYCGGGDCDLSRNLAFSMIDAGRKRVLVFLGGLPEWRQASLPVNTGMQP